MAPQSTKDLQEIRLTKNDIKLLSTTAIEHFNQSTLCVKFNRLTEKSEYEQKVAWAKSGGLPPVLALGLPARGEDKEEVDVNRKQYISKLCC